VSAFADITPNQWTILEALKDGPRWIRSFQTVKPLLEKLVKRGLIERCHPHLGRGRNMVRLTVAGCDALEIDAGSVPIERCKETPAPPKLVKLGEISGAATEETRKICERFRDALAAGKTSNEAVGELAALNDVQRPAIWKRLRAGGVIAPYAQQQSGGKGRPIGGGEYGYTERRRGRSLAEAARHEPRQDQFVDRDPCPRCGVRGDLGCRHNRAAA
jgi:DNA-binding MarR family transcriptional regulator